jgi:hypothetical protein
VKTEEFKAKAMSSFSLSLFNYQFAGMWFPPFLLGVNARIIQ